MTSAAWSSTAPGSPRWTLPCGRQAVGAAVDRAALRRAPDPAGVGLYLRRWGFTPQKPIRRAYEQQPAAVKRWLDEQYPAIEHRASLRVPKSTGRTRPGCAPMMCVDRPYAPMGQTPEIKVNQRREGLSLISSVTNRGKVRSRSSRAPCMPPS